MRLLNEVKKYPYSELNFFEETSDEIIKCRQVLKWTYVVSFISEGEMKPNELQLFKF